MRSVSTTRSQMVTRALMTFRSKSKQLCIKRFRRSSISWIFVSHTLCCITPQISKYKAHDDPGPLWWSYDTSDAIFLGDMPLWYYMFGVLSFTRYCSNINYVKWVKFILPHVPFISNSNSENCIKIRWCLTKLQTKISWLRCMAHGVLTGFEFRENKNILYYV